MRGTVEEGDVFWLFGVLRVTQRRQKEARQLLGRALSVYERIDHLRGQINALNERASLAFYRHDLDAAATDLQEAVRLLEGCDDAELWIPTLYNLANCQARGGLGCEARATLRRLDDVRGGPAPERSQQLLELWLEGASEEVEGGRGRAEEIYRRVVAGFNALQEPLSRSLAQLDLALLLSRDGPAAEACQLAVETLPVFQSFELSRETNECLAVVRRAVARARVEEAVLRDALRSDPLVRIACPRR